MEEKKMIKQFIQQGWVPQTCSLTEQQALILWPSVFAGTDPCDGCNYDRSVCKGRPKVVVVEDGEVAFEKRVPTVDGEPIGKGEM